MAGKVERTIDVKGYGPITVLVPPGASREMVKSALMSKILPSDQFWKWRLRDQGNLKAPAATLANQLHSGARSALTGLGADSYNANRVAGNLTQGLADITPVGGAVSADDARIAAKEGRYGAALGNSVLAGLDLIPGVGKAAALGAKTAVPLIAKGVPNALGMFLARHGGEDKMFERALQMEKKGADPQKIWEEAGYNKQHGDWQREISDKGLRVREEAIPEDPNARVAIWDAIEHPKLEAEMPQFFEGLTVARETNPDYAGSFDYNTQILRLDPNADYNLESIAAHELQHGVSYWNNWPVGGNIMAPPDYADPEYLFWKGAVADEIEQMDKLYAAGDYEGYERARIRMNANTERMMKEGQPGEKYFDVADEVKARNVENRLLNYKDADLKSILPQDTQEVPDEFQYVKYPRQRFIWKGGRLLNPSTGGVMPTKTPGIIAPNALFGFEKDPLERFRRGY
jgi:hypothetical protein